VFLAKLLSNLLYFEKTHCNFFFFQSTFLGNPNFASFIKILSNVLTSEEIQRDEAVTAFQATKYSVTLSNKTFHYLMRYLQTQQSMGQPPVLLHVLHAKVDVRLLDALGAPSSKFEAIQRVQTDVIEISEVKSEKSNNSGGEKNKSINCFVIKQEQPPPQAELLNGAVTTAATASTTAAAAASSSTASVAKLKEVIKAVRDGVTPLPSTCLYRVTQHNVNCAAISQNAQILATGCDDSSLVLWDLLPNNHHNNSAAASKSHFCFDDELDDPSAIRLGCDLEDKFVGSRGSKKRSSILRGHSGPVYDVTFMARTKYLMSVSEDTTARLWDLETGLNKAIFQGHAYPIWSVDSDRLGVNIATGKPKPT
jgi:WD40 repeat protein